MQNIHPSQMFTGSLAERRRVLTCQAVQPCPSASPSTLLAALIALAADIDSFRGSHRFPVLRRCVREALREVGIIIAFLTDVRDRGPDVPHSAAVGFAELHMALQKLLCLIQDCAGKDARLWVLMNADRVLSEFRAQIRAISTALDILPLDSVHADKEMKEMIRMLTRQSWKVEIRIDREDDRAIRAVRSILDQFKSGVSPDPTDLRRLLSYLGVMDWDDCNEAITFMEEEISEHCDDEDNINGEAGLLGSLLGLLIYCRAVLFNVHASINPKKCDRRKDRQFNDERSLNFLNPDSLRCPISLDLMLDPVTISTGQTYDRESILRWFKDGLDTCPVTGEKLKHTNSVPNSSLQKLVRDFCVLKKIPIAEPSNKKKRGLAKTLHPQSLAAVEAARMTAVFLAGKLSSGTGEEKNRAAYEIRVLAKSSLFHRICLVEADCVPWLLHLVSSSDPSTQDNVVAALLNISKHPSGRTAIFEVGGASLIVDAITDGLKVEIQQNAAAILFYLSSVQEYRQEIGEVPGAIPALVNLLKKGTYRGKKNAIVALFGLLLLHGNHPRVLATGIIPILMDLLIDEREDLVNDCVGVLAKIAERSEGAKMILKSSSDVLQKLVQVLQSASSRSGKEYSVSLMLFLCLNGGQKVIKQLDSLPLLMPSLYSIVAGGPPQASKKARTLINHIHQIYDQDQDQDQDQDRSISALTSPLHDQMVHTL